MSSVSSAQPSGSSDADGRSHGRTYGRLRRSADFRMVLEQGARRSGERMVLYVRPGEQGIRVGFVTGRAVGSAVHRNRARRRLKEAWRSLASRARGGLDLVVVARPGIRHAKTQELTAEMEVLLKVGGVIQL